MTTKRIDVCLPTEDRSRAHAFYSRGLGFQTPGGLGDDGVPEPLRVVVNDGVALMLIPQGGFGWVTADRETAAPETAECLISLQVDAPADVDSYLERAAAAGGEIAAAAEQKDWGYCGVFADPDGHLWQVVTGGA